MDAAALRIERGEHQHVRAHRDIVHAGNEKRIKPFFPGIRVLRLGRGVGRLFRLGRRPVCRELGSRIDRGLMQQECCYCDPRNDDDRQDIYRGNEQHTRSLILLFLRIPEIILFHIQSF